LEYLTDEDIKIAEANGIPERNLKYRVYWLGWPKKRAMTQPCITPKKLWPQWKEECEKIGISYSTFYRRMKEMGMTPEQAATTPHMDSHTLRRSKYIVTKEAIERAAQYGVSLQTLRYRVYRYHWELERAITTPPNPKYRRKS
jgi:Zn-dependent peptidase ImmA (M78 family)